MTFVQKKAFEVMPDLLPTICFENGIRQTKKQPAFHLQNWRMKRGLFGCCGGLKRGRFAFGCVASDEKRHFMPTDFRSTEIFCRNQEKFSVQ